MNQISKEKWLKAIFKSFSYLHSRQAYFEVGRTRYVGQDQRVEVHGGDVTPGGQVVALLAAAIAVVVVVLFLDFTVGHCWDRKYLMD